MKKTNKTFKRFAAITSASLLAACAMAPVFTSMISYAAANDFTLSAPSDLPANSAITNVRAYKIFAGTYDESKNTFNVTAFADGVTGATLGMDSTISAAAAAEAITEDNKDAVAKAAAVALGSGTGIKGTYDAENSKVKFASDLDVGYYLVLCDVERDDKDADTEATTYDAVSLGMLTVTGTDNENIGYDGNAKVGLPEVIKKVKENSSITAPEIEINGKRFEADENDEYNDVADYNIGDNVPFKLYGSLPVDLANYDTYYYKFTDTLGNEFGEASNYTVSVVNNGVSTPLANAVEITDADDTTTHTNYTYQKVSSADNDFTITFNDVKNLLDADGNKIVVNSNSIITVEYEAELLDTAAIGLPGQRNSVNLTYSNNPNKSGSGTNDDADENTGTTPDDEVIVFTYEIDVTKTFQDAAGNDISSDVEATIKQQVVFNLKDASGNVINFSQDETNKYYYVDEEGSAALTLYDLTTGKFEVRGLDKGTYTLVETAWPTGYNKAGDTTIEVKAVTNNAEEWDDGIAYSALTGWGTDVYDNTTDEAKDSIAEATVINKKGTTLPGTGGIGTTIFYLGGGAMATIGGVYLISKRRMKKSEE